MIHDADVLLFGLQNRALLDVDLQERLDVGALVGGDRIRVEAVCLHRVVDAHAVLVLVAADVVHRELRVQHLAGEQAGFEARALLVVGGDHLDGVVRLPAAFDELAHRLDAAHHARDAVVCAAEPHRIEVRADHDGVGHLALQPADDRAGVVHAHGEADFLHAGFDVFAGRAGLGCEGEAGDAAARRGGEGAQLAELGADALRDWFDCHVESHSHKKRRARTISLCVRAVASLFLLCASRPDNPPLTHNCLYYRR